MTFRKFFIMIAMCIVCIHILGAKTLGTGGVSVYEGEKLQWNEGAHDYFVMFKSLLDRFEGNNDSPGNPQADACMDMSVGSTYSLEQRFLPADAYVERAFLVWMAVTDPAEYNSPTDNSVTLSFDNEDGLFSHEAEITSSIAGELNQDYDFAYESISISEASSESIFTYRVDVTSFFEQIHEKARDYDFPDTRSDLLGNYTVKNLKCTESMNYQNVSGMVNGWALIMVYQSSTITPKKIYLYDGVQRYRGESKDINVSGFELPPEADVRITLFIAEGDPGLYSAMYPGQEGLQLSGATNPEWVKLFNECNPDKATYVELYNSISSVFPLGSSTPECVGGMPDAINLDEMEYAMDVDTLQFNGGDWPFDSHLMKGDTEFWLKIGANQDQVFTNFMILSVDTRPPDFDIPDEDEKMSCGCGETPDTFCEGKEFYYAIKIQNWGDDDAHNVKVRDDLPEKLKYVSGSAEKSIDNGKSWVKIEDRAGGMFPLVEPVDIIDFLRHCSIEEQTCPNTAWVRFKVIPGSGMSKKDVVNNTAYIFSDGGEAYATNLGIPHRLKIGNCNPSCVAPDLSLCGGESTCVDDGDCSDGFSCEDGRCVEKAANLSANAVIEYGQGEESPDSQNAHPIIINDANSSDNLVVGQFYLRDKNGSSKDTGFSFDEITTTFETGDSKIMLSDVNIMKDENGNGVVDGNDRAIGTALSLNNGSAKISINASDRIFDTAKKHYFLITVDAAYPESMKIVGTNTYFKAIIEGANAVAVSDAGNATVEGSRIDFARFYFEPTTGFLISINGEHSTTIEPSTLNGVHNILYIRTKSIDQTVVIKSMMASVGNSAYAKFGAGIKKISLWKDNDNDGSPDILLSEPEISEEKNYVQFNNLGEMLSYTPGSEIFLIIQVEFKLSIDESAQVVIERNRITFDNAVADLTGEDLKSEVYTYSCEGGACGEKDAACNCSLTKSDQDSPTLLFLVMSAIMLFVIRRKALF